MGWVAVAGTSTQAHVRHGRRPVEQAAAAAGHGAVGAPLTGGPARDGMPVLPCLAATRVPRSGDRVVVGQGRAGVPSLAGLPRSGG